MKNNRKEECQRFVLSVRNWKDDHFDEFCDYCTAMRNIDGKGILDAARTLFFYCPKFFSAWTVCVRDESYSDYDALTGLVSKTDFAERLIKKFNYPGKDNSVPLFMSWLYFANSFETIVMVLSSQINSNSNTIKKQLVHYGIKKAISVSLKMDYRNEEQWRNFLEIEEDAGTDNMAIRILEKHFSNAGDEISAIEKDYNENDKGRIVNNFYTQQNINIQQNLFSQSVYVYADAEECNEDSSSKPNSEKQESRPLYLEYNIPAENQRLEDYIISAENYPCLIDKIESHLKSITKDKSKVYARIKIILEENGLLKDECKSDVTCFYNAVLLQYQNSGIKHITLRSVQKAYKAMMESIRLPNGSYRLIKDLEEERSLINHLAEILLEKS